MKTFNFIFSLHMLNPILLLVQKVSSTLQSSDLGLLSAVSIVQSLKTSLNNLRTDNDSSKKVYEETIKICSENKIIIPEVKNVLSFIQLWMKWFLGFLAFQSRNFKFNYSNRNFIQLKLDSNDILILKEKFNLDSAFEYEIKLIKNMFNATSIKRSSTKIIVARLKTTFSNFNKALIQFATIHVTSCSCERTFSKLSIVRSKFRNTMLQ